MSAFYVSCNTKYAGLFYSDSSWPEPWRRWTTRLGVSQQLDMDVNTSNNLFSLRIATYNMHGVNSNWSYVQDLCDNYDIIFIQEHWLMESKLHYL